MLPTNFKRGRKAQQRFREAVTEFFKDLGVQPGRFYDLELDTPAGLLQISIYDSWVATRFDNLVLGKVFTSSCGRPCNPYSGKWNFHYPKTLTPEVAISDLRFWFRFLMDWEYQFELSYDDCPIHATPQR